MPAIPDLRLSLSSAEVRRDWGARRWKLASQRMRTLVSEILVYMDAERLLRPAISYRIWPVAGRGPSWLELASGGRLHKASRLAFGVCTLGSRLEQQVSEWFTARERVRAALLDEIGTFALYRLGERFEQIVREEAAQKGLEASGLLSPGDDGFDLREQATVVELAGGAEIGVSLTGIGMLAPRKTLSMVVGLGKEMPRWSRAENCARCQKRARCPHRRQPAAEVAP